MGEERSRRSPSEILRDLIVRVGKLGTDLEDADNPGLYPKDGAALLVLLNQPQFKDGDKLVDFEKQIKVERLDGLAKRLTDFKRHHRKGELKPEDEQKALSLKNCQFAPTRPSKHRIAPGSGPLQGPTIRLCPYGRGFGTSGMGSSTDIERSAALVSSGLLSETGTAHTGHWPVPAFAALRTVRLDLRCDCKFQGTVNSHIADNAPIRCASPNGSFQRIAPAAKGGTGETGPQPRSRACQPRKEEADIQTRRLRGELLHRCKWLRRQGRLCL